MKKTLSTLLIVILVALVAIPAFSFAAPQELKVISLSISSKEYDGTKWPTSRGVSIVTSPGLSRVGDTYISFTTEFEDANAGKNKKVTITDISLGGSDAGNYYLNWAAPTVYYVDIYPRKVSIAKCVADDKEYDGTTATKAYFIPYNILKEEEDKVSIVGDAEFDDANVGSNKYVNVSNIRLVGDSTLLANYELNTTSMRTRADITARTVTVDGITASDKEYDGNSTAAVSLQYSGVLPGEDVTVTANGYFCNDQGVDASVGQKKVKVYTPQLSGSGKKNYKLSVAENLEGKAAITPKAVTVSGILAKDKEEDGTTDATLDCSMATISGLVGLDTVGVEATGSFEDANPGIDKKVNINSINLTGKLANNYKLASSGQQTQAYATIVENPNLHIPATVELSKTKLTFKNSTPQKVTATFSDKNDSIVKVKSSSSKIAKVKYSGNEITVTPAKKTGKATITVETAKGAKKKLTVTVKEGASLNEKSITLKKGEKFKIKVSAFPSSIKAKEFKSNKPKVAKVDKKGRVTAKKKGKATITVTLSNGKKLKLKVTVE